MDHADQPSHERRRATRRDALDLLAVDLASPGRLYTLACLSERGLRLLHAEPIKKGERLSLGFEVGGREVRVNAQVAWCGDAGAFSSQPWAVGLVFVDLGDEERALIRAFVCGQVA